MAERLTATARSALTERELHDISTLISEGGYTVEQAIEEVRRPKRRVTWRAPERGAGRSTESKVSP